MCRFHGLQVRDEFRMDYDPGRGGFGKIRQQEVTNHIQQMQMGGEELQADCVHALFVIVMLNA